MNNVAGAILLVFTLVAPMVVYGAYRLLRHAKNGRPIGLALAAASAVLLGLGAIQLFAGGELVDGWVSRKSETVQLARLQLIPSVLHILRVEVRTGAPDSAQVGGDLTLALAPRAFDRLHEGDAVRLRQTAIGPLRFARLADAGPWSQVPGLEFTGLLAVFASAAGLLALGFGILTPIMGRRGRAVFVALAMLAVLLAGGATRPLWMSRPLRTQATVLSSRTVTEALLPSRLERRSTEAFRLPKPYDEVSLQLTPRPGADPVTAIDRVDAGSAGVLAPGDTVPVAFDPGEPRDARLTAGRRSYAVAAYAARFGAPAALGAVAALAVFSAMVWLARRRERRPAPTPSSA